MLERSKQLWAVTVTVTVMLVVATLTLSGCGRDAPETHADAPAPAESAPVAAQGGDTQRPTAGVTLESLGGTGTIRGVAKLSGTPPPPKTITVTGDPTCEAAYRDHPMQASDVIVSPGGGLANVFVYVKHGLESVQFAVPAESVVLDQLACMYVPRVLGLLVGQPLLVRNSDPTLHNVHGLSSLDRERDFNFGLPRQGAEVPKTFSTPEVMFRMKCDVHPWMAAWIGVLEHPVYAVTEGTGRFELPRLPAGEYEVEAWHERYGSQVQTLVLADGLAIEVEFVFAAAP